MCSSDLRYLDRLSGIKGIHISNIRPGIRRNYAYFPVLFDGYKMNRDMIYEKLKNKGIFTRKYFYPLTNAFRCYKGEFDLSRTPIAQHIADRVLVLPLYADLSFKDVDRICDYILNDK